MFLGLIFTIHNEMHKMALYFNNAYNVRSPVKREHFEPYINIFMCIHKHTQHMHTHTSCIYIFLCLFISLSLTIAVKFMYNLIIPRYQQQLIIKHNYKAILYQKLYNIISFSKMNHFGRM